MCVFELLEYYALWLFEVLFFFFFFNLSIPLVEIGF